jgi:hypothetical protein
VLQPGHGGKRLIGRQKVEWPALLDQVPPGVAVELDNGVDRWFIAEKRKGCDERAGADAGDHVKFRHGERPVHARPTFENAGTEGAPIAAAGQYQDVIYHWRTRMRVVARFHALDNSLSQGATPLRHLGIVHLALRQQLRWRACRPDARTAGTQ